MLLAISLSLLAAVSADPTVLKTKIVEAAIYQAGYAYVVREVELPKGTGNYQLDVVPEPILGTFWYRADKGAVIDDVTLRTSVKREEQSIPITDIPDVLAHNVGKTITVTVATGQNQTEKVTGKLLSYNGGALTFQISNGTWKSVSAGIVLELETEGLTLTKSAKIVKPSQSIAFEASADRPTKAYFATVETMASWYPGYSLSLNADNKAKISGQARFNVGATKWDDVATRIVTGDPVSAQQIDPIAGIASLKNQMAMAAFVAGIASPYLVTPDTIVKWYLTELQKQMNRQNSYYGGGFGMGGGGFGGGGGIPGMDFISYDPTDSSIVNPNFDRGTMITGNRPGTFNESGNKRGNSSASRTQDVYAYDIGKITVEPGDVRIRQLFDYDVKYDSLMKWMIVESDDGRYANKSSLESIVRVKNETKAPWPTGDVFVQRDGLPLMQVQMPFCAAGETADISLGSPEDLVSKYERTETDRKPIPNPDPKQPSKGTWWITTEAVFTFKNTRAETLNLELTYTFTGSADNAGGATITQIAVPGGANNLLNTTCKASWKVKVAPGEEKIFKLVATRRAY